MKCGNKDHRNIEVVVDEDYGINLTRESGRETSPVVKKKEGLRGKKDPSGKEYKPTGLPPFPQLPESL
jgi:hypothetical protein